MTSHFLRAAVHRLDRVDSTNLYLKTIIDCSTPIGTTVVARTQTAGRGRGDHSWLSEPGGLYCSILLDAAADRRLTDRVFVAGLAVATTLESFDLTPRLKWPNDCLIDRKKIAGVLCETVDLHCIVGIGINVQQSSFVLSDAAAFPPTSIYLETGCSIDLDTVLVRLRKELEHCDMLCRREGFDSICRMWERRCDFIGRLVTVEDAGVRCVGVFEGLADNGAMRVRTEAGQQIFSSGNLVWS